MPDTVEKQRMTLDGLKAILAQVRYKDWSFEVTEDRIVTFIVSVMMPTHDVDELKAIMVGRPCSIWSTDTEAQVLERLFAAVVSVEQHEASELFDFKETRPFNEHRPVIGVPQRMTFMHMNRVDSGQRGKPVSCSMDQRTIAILESLAQRSRRSKSQTLALAFEIAMVLNPLIMEKLIIDPSLALEPRD